MSSLWPRHSSKKVASSLYCLCYGCTRLCKTMLAVVSFHFRELVLCNAVKNRVVGGTWAVFTGTCVYME